MPELIKASLYISFTWFWMHRGLLDASLKGLGQGLLGALLKVLYKEMTLSQNLFPARS